MKKQTFGEMVVSLRKENNMTQRQLAEKMGVTDKAVSKWERDLSFPDVDSLPKLAEVFGISVDELMQVKVQKEDKGKWAQVTDTVLKAVPLAMSVAVCALSVMKRLEIETGITLLAIGMVCMSIREFNK